MLDVTTWLDDHPGGGEIILEFAGGDATPVFEDIGHSSEARELLKKFVIGDLSGTNSQSLKSLKSSLSWLLV